MKTYNSTFVDGHLHSEVTYQFETEPASVSVSDFDLCEPLAEDCGYWAATSDGQCRGFKSSDGQGCIATLEDALHGLDLDSYIVWQLKDATPGKWKRWSEKWTRRMTVPSMAGSW